jgi:hypothetical protein
MLIPLQGSPGKIQGVRRRRSLWARFTRAIRYFFVEAARYKRKHHIDLDW